MIDNLRTTDLKMILELASKQNNQKACEHIKGIQKALDPKAEYDLDMFTLKALSENDMVHSLLILYFLTKNVTLEYIRRNNIVILSPKINVSEYWEEEQLSQVICLNCV